MTTTTQPSLSPWTVATKNVAEKEIPDVASSRLYFMYDREGKLVVDSGGVYSTVDIINLFVDLTVVRTVTLYLFPANHDETLDLSQTENTSTDGSEITIQPAEGQRHAELTLTTPLPQDPLIKQTRYWEFSKKAVRPPDPPNPTVLSNKRAPVRLKVKVKVTRIDSDKDIKNSTP